MRGRRVVAAAAQPRSASGNETPPSGLAYRLKLGRETIRLSPIEYRVLYFLAANPYHAYTRRLIVNAVTTERLPVTEQTLDRHIASLRGKLGFFGNYIQTVPYIGYRFKAYARSLSPRSGENADRLRLFQAGFVSATACLPLTLRESVAGVTIGSPNSQASAVTCRDIFWPII